MPTWSILAGSVTPATSMPARSGAASRNAPSMAVRTVTVDDGQPSQWPSSRRCATPSPSTPRYVTPPACDPRYGRTRSSACWMRVSTSTGCRSCSNNRLPTSFVAGQFAHQLRVTLPKQRHDVRQALAVETDQEPDQFLRQITGPARREAAEQVLDLLAHGLRGAAHVSIRR